MSFQTIRLNLSDAQYKNLLKGQTVQLANEDINHGEPFHFSVRNNNKLVKALENGKGVRISLTQAELRENRRIEGAGFGNVMKKARNVGKKVQNVSNKVSKNVARADRIVGKIDRALDRGEFIGKMSIPIVSDAYSGIHEGVNQLHNATSTARKVTKASNDFVQKPSLSTLNTATKVAKSEYKSNSNNPYMPDVQGAGRKRGGSFRTQGGSFRTQGGSVRVFNDNSNFVKPGHNSFKPVPPPRYGA